MVITNELKVGKTRSCGCLYRESRPFANRKHGESHSASEYKTWAHIKYRCYDKNCKAYNLYGGRGIKVCDRWLGENGYENFLQDMGRKPSKIHSLDRHPDINGDYEPLNCRWATPKQQTRNTRVNHWIEYKGERKVLRDWSIELRTRNLMRTAQVMGMNEAIEYYKSTVKDRTEKQFKKKVSW